MIPQQVYEEMLASEDGKRWLDAIQVQFNECIVDVHTIAVDTSFGTEHWQPFFAGVAQAVSVMVTGDAKERESVLASEVAALIQRRRLAESQRLVAPADAEKKLVVVTR